MKTGSPRGLTDLDTQMELSEKLRAQNQKSLDSHKKREQNLKDEQSVLQESIDSLKQAYDELKTATDVKETLEAESKASHEALVESERESLVENEALKEEIMEKKKRIQEMKSTFSQVCFPCTRLESLVTCT